MNTLVRSTLIKTSLSSSKRITVIGKSNGVTYDKSKSICKDICGNLYFPSTLKDDAEIESLLNDHFLNGGKLLGWHFIRIVKTQNIWKDPDDKENLTFTNWAEGSPDADDKYHVCDRALMDYQGEWLDTPDTLDISTEFFFELS